MKCRVGREPQIIVYGARMRCYGYEACRYRLKSAAAGTAVLGGRGLRGPSSAFFCLRDHLKAFGRRPGMQPIASITAGGSGYTSRRRARNVAARLAEGLPPERLSFLREIQERVASGFYNTEPVIEDLCHSFTKAVDALV